jgi:hypothetical protein
MVLDLFAEPRPECKEGCFCSRVIAKEAFVVVENAVLGHRFGWIFSKKARTSAGLTFTLLRLMFVGFRFRTLVIIYDQTKHQNI